ncbi:hypothetical protein [Nocardioides sp. SYSU D00038]|uniref:hypothetical protein n=1 Tax=Nocardioides sp. SYSU D00038 TaxID=2812554 RepID=UPI001967C396|nr:hypothetical protein [Nocardioides sp. SYSU D00038]
MLDLVQDNPVAGFIALSEVGLWVLLGLGLTARYPLRLRRTGAVLLAGIPLLDVALVVAGAVDLHRGAQPGAVHGLAAVYLGASVAFGPTVVRWADVRFAHRFDDGPAPVRHPKGSPARVAALWTEWVRVVLAATIASAALGAAVLLVEPGQRESLLSWVVRCWAVVGLWLLLGPLWESATPRRPSPAPRPRRRGGSAAAGGGARSGGSR